MLVPLKKNVLGPKTGLRGDDTFSMMPGGLRAAWPNQQQKRGLGSLPGYQKTGLVKLDRGRGYSLMASFVLRHIRVIAGNWGQAIGTFLALILVMGYEAFQGGWLAEVALITILLRLWLRAKDESEQVLKNGGNRISAGKLLQGEAFFSVGFLAACFLFYWPLNVSVSVGFLVANLVFQFTLLGLSQMIYQEHRLDGSPAVTSGDQNVLVIGSGITAQRAVDSILDRPEASATIIGFLDSTRRDLWRYRDIPLIGGFDKLESLAADQQIDLVLLATETSEKTESVDLFERAERMGLPMAFVTNTYKPKLASGVATSFVDMPVIYYRSVPDNAWSLLVKNCIDRVAAILGLIVISPIVVVTSLIIKFESKGPVFFKQIRSGLNGKTFKMYKFRTMRADAEATKGSLMDRNEMSGPVFKIKDDPRITRVGRYLRKFSIDELPQLINVLKGDMSLVGPRPPLPREVSAMEPWQRRKLSVKPGVTCTWQVSGRNDIDFEDWMKLDLEYIDNWSLWEDAKLLARTLPTVIKGTGS